MKTPNQNLFLVLALTAGLNLLPTSRAQAASDTVLAWGSNTYGLTNVPASLTNVTAIAGGRQFSVALKSDGTVAAWGTNYIPGETNIPAGLSNVTAIAAGGYHTLALKSDHTMVAWGWNLYTQTTIPPGLTNVIAIAAGDSHSVALKSDGTVAAWGINGLGQVNGDASCDGCTATTNSVSLNGQTLTNVIAIAAEGDRTIALNADGTVVTWGSYNTTLPSSLTNVSAIAAGYAHYLALKADSTVVAWGDNTYGQTSVPIGLSGVKAIAAGIHCSAALKTDGTVVAWGDNTYGQTNVPAGLTNATVIAAGYFDAMAIIGTVLSPPGPTNIVVSPAGPVIGAGSNQQFSATGYYTDGSFQILTNGSGGINLLWSSGNTNVASVDTNGLATGLTNGVSSITATSGNVSGNTTLTVVSTPTISMQPTNNMVSPNDSVTLSVNAAGGQLSYQWLLNGTNIFGATGATLTISNVTSASIGVYTVIVSNLAGSTTSQVAIVGTTAIQMFAGVIINGPLGSNYVIQSRSNMLNPWTTRTNLALSSQPYIYIDYNSPTNPQQFYRATPQ